MSAWIRVEDRLPETTGVVLCWVERLGCELGTNFEGTMSLMVSDGKVTHWQPLPEPPEVK